MKVCPALEIEPECGNRLGYKTSFLIRSNQHNSAAASEQDLSHSIYPSFSMMLSSFIPILTFAASTAAYKATFYIGPMCEGEELGQFTGGPSAGCQTSYAGVASSVLISQEPSDNNGGTVAFYSTSDCDLSKAIATSDVSLRNEQGCNSIFEF